MRGRRWLSWRVALGAFVCVLLPLSSWLVDGRGSLAFTMYASTVTYRLALDAIDAAGGRRALAPAAVAEQVNVDSVAPFLRGADVFRTVAQIDALRSHLGDVARAACRTGPASSTEITLDERASTSPDENSSTSRTTERVACPSRR